MAPNILGKKKCNNGQIVSHRLDRGVSDHSWKMLFPEASVEHLVKRHSDHNPLLLRCTHGVVSSNARPFRFQACCTHEEYPLLVK